MSALSPTVPLCGEDARNMAPEPGSHRYSRLLAAKQDIRDRYRPQYARILEAMQAELDDLEARFWSGEVR